MMSPGPSAGCPDRTGNQMGPHVDVVGGVTDHGRLAGRPGRGMDAHDPVARHGETCPKG